jgi:putative ABC transport system permease protein
LTPLLELGPLQLLLLAVPVAVVLAVSAALRLGQVRRVVVASVRAVVQLVAAGLVIGWVFRQQGAVTVLALLAVMTVIAGFTGATQAGRRVAGTAWWMTGVLGLSMGLTLAFLARVVIGVESWDPRYLVPLGGMLLGNAMTAATLAAERLGDELARSRGDVEVYLSLGASPWQAIHPSLRRALGAALTPTVNAMMVVGVVKLPGMMSGQLLGGSAPLQAAFYQLLILVGILLGDTLSATATSVILSRRFFTPAWRLDRRALS